MTNKIPVKAAVNKQTSSDMDVKTFELVNVLVDLLSTHLISKGDDHHERKKNSNIRTSIN